MDAVSGRWLLISLLISLLIIPLFEGLQAGRALLIAGFTFTFIFAAFSVRKNMRLIAFAVLAVSLPSSWATLFVDSLPLHLFYCLLGSAFFWTIGGLIVFRVIKQRVIDIDSVFHAISAYLLFGLAWALSYWAVFTVSPESFPIADLRDSIDSRNEEFVDFSQFIYYSFVTMSTLGYGDITPEGRIARTLSWIQSVTGQFYVAVVIAWMVSALPRPGDRD